MKQFIFTSYLLLFSFIAYCQPGSIDPSFGEEGIVRTASDKTNFYSQGGFSALQQDGKILVGGKTDVASLIRYLPDGTIDSSFGENGITIIEVKKSGVRGIAIQPDGRIVVAGYSLEESISTSTSFVARLHEDGTPDPSYGSNGFALFNFGDYSQFNAIALQENGKLLITGGGTDNPENTILSYGFIIRLTADGSLDEAFGGTGRIINNAVNISTCITVQPDGKILTAGDKHNPFTFDQSYVVSRYNEDGTPDEQFGTNGVATTGGFGYEAQPLSILVQPDNKIVLGGYSILGAEEAYYMIALRYEANGAPDETFGEGGKVVVTFESKQAKAYSALLQSDGKIILAGGAYNDPYSDADFGLCRLNRDGSMDSSFAINGRQVTELDNTLDEAYSALLQPDGKIILIGYSQNQQGSKLYNLLIRYNGDKDQQPLITRIKRWLRNHGISWQGLDNKNILYYSVQYSKTGKGFAEKGKISGAGSSNLQQYDFNVTDAGFYRVVAVDKKGYKIFSNKVMVRESDIASAASIYPNPVRDYVSVQGLKSNEQANISIANANGTVVARGVSSGSTQYRTAAGNLQRGTYFLHITTNSGKTETLQFVKE